MRILLRIAAAMLLAPLALAAASPQEAARLGSDLTPLGGEQAANADGSIPAWSGGIMSATAAGFPGYKPGDHHPDPYAGDPPLFAISAADLPRYAARLTAGHRALLAAYPDYRMLVYPSHRSAAVPERIAQNTRRGAATTYLFVDGNGVTGALGAIPFPLPKSGLEVMWNHLLRFRGVAVARQVGQAAVTTGGTYSLVNVKEQFYFPYYLAGMSVAGLQNVYQYLRHEASTATHPVGAAVLLLQELLDQSVESRRAWIYTPAQRRVRRDLQSGFDNAAADSDELRTDDQSDMYSGSPQRYDWNLLGRQELYVPYNSYRLQNEKIRYWDLLRAHHINQEYARYELHRVWVVDATLKPGERHLYARRTFYVDEDSWQILAVDCYDAQGKLFRVQEGHVINYYEVPTLWTDLELVMDLNSGRYLAVGLQNEESRSYDFNIKRTADDFQPSVLERLGVR
jgi:hypothetical protein